MGRVVDSSGKVTEFSDKFDLHLSPILAGSQMIVLTEHIAGQSAFELISILQAMEERKEFTICLLHEAVRAQSTMYACFLHNVSLCLTLDASQELFAQKFLHVRQYMETRE